MAQTMEINIIANYLKNLPIAPIFDSSHEKDNLIALKLMCVVNFYMQRDHRKLYERMNAYPKLKSQLLEFHSYSHFTYYDYQVNKTKLGKSVFQCTYCDLVGPTANIMTHLAISHNIHTASKICVYCKRKNFRNHFYESSFDECYQNYILKNHIEWDGIVCGIICDFYDLLKLMSKVLNVCINRQHNYAAKGRTSVEKLNLDYGKDFPSECTVFYQKSLRSKVAYKNVSTQSATLCKVYNEIISYMFGGNRASRLALPATILSDDNAVIISDNEEETKSEQSINLSRSVSVKSIESEIEMKQINESAIHQADTLTVTPSDFVTTIQSYHTQKTPEEQFGEYVAQRLAKLPDDLSRRRLENAIQEAIVNAEKAAFQ